MSGRGELEAQFADWVIEACLRFGWQAWRTHDSRRSPEGEPDLRIVPRRDGRASGRRVIWAELKRLGEVPTPAQVEALADLRAAGEDAYLWYPTDRDLILRLLCMPGDVVG